ncbi:hypothetical protein QP117_09770, partial [Actinotignum timonense]|uniref:hypothetical protein n=1 Tax=Actinotignum timonense TaxID=1870995 RepID=UPI00254B6F08
VTVVAVVVVAHVPLVVALRAVPAQTPVAVSEVLPAVVDVVDAAQLRAHSVAEAVAISADASRSAQNVKSSNSRMHPSLVAFRFLAETARLS